MPEVDKFRCLKCVLFILLTQGKACACSLAILCVTETLLLLPVVQDEICGDSKAFAEGLLWWEVTGVLFCCKLSLPSFISLIFVQILCLISTDRQTIFHGFPAKYVDLCYWRNLSVINQAHSVDLEGKG